MERQGSNNIRGREQVFLFTNTGNHIEGLFREVCEELQLKLVSIKGRVEEGVFHPLSENRPIAAIVVQKRQPGENLTLISEIKITLKKLPIIFYSTRYSEALENLIRRAGVHYFLLPDFQKKELDLVLDRLCERSRGGMN